jgi:hypothetical protein
MSYWTRIFRSTVYSLLLISVTVAPVRRSEIRKHLPGATGELARSSGVDTRTEMRVRKALENGFAAAPGPWGNAASAERTVARELRMKSFGLESGRNGLKVLSQPSKRYTNAEQTRLSRSLVRSITSRIRRRSIASEIGPGMSRTVHPMELGLYLRDDLKLPDHHEVRNSFDSNQDAEIITLEKDIKLLRLYMEEPQNRLGDSTSAACGPRKLSWVWLAGQMRADWLLRLRTSPTIWL